MVGSAVDTDEMRLLSVRLYRRRSEGPPRLATCVLFLWLLGILADRAAGLRACLPDSSTGQLCPASVLCPVLHLLRLSVQRVDYTNGHRTGLQAGLPPYTAAKHGLVLVSQFGAEQCQAPAIGDHAY